MDEFISISVVTSITYSLEELGGDKSIDKYDSVIPLYTEIHKEASKIINAYKVIKTFRFDNDYVKSSTLLIVSAIVDGIPMNIHRVILHKLVDKCCKFGSWGYSYIYGSTKKKFLEK